MSYLNDFSSKTNIGVVEVGDFINVIEGVISLSQDISPTSDVLFNSVNAFELFSNGEEVVTQVLPIADLGISLSDVTSTGPVSSFTIKNTGVLSLTAGSGISLSSSTGNISISSTGTELLPVKGVTANYTVTASDEYIGVSSTSNITITLPTGINGRVYTIKDEYGQGSGKITILPQVGEKVDNATSYIIGVPHQSVSIIFRAGSWWVI